MRLCQQQHGIVQWKPVVLQLMHLLISCPPILHQSNSSYKSKKAVAALFHFIRLCIFCCAHGKFFTCTYRHQAVFSYTSSLGLILLPPAGKAYKALCIKCCCCLLCNSSRLVFILQVSADPAISFVANSSTNHANSNVAVRPQTCANVTEEMPALKLSTVKQAHAALSQ